MPTFLITGGTGLVGAALTRHLLRSGHTVTVLTRSPAPDRTMPTGLSQRYWNPYKGEIDEAAIREADYIVHLAGANVAEKRWTRQRKQEILESRVRSGQFLVDTLGRVPNRVKAVLGASAQGWYGPDPQIPNPRPFQETDPCHPDFLGTTCEKWEASVQGIRTMGIRLVQLRIGIVLSLEGGALAEFHTPVRFGIAPILGSGRQVISWIHILDLASMIEWALLNDSVQGIYNAATPNPVSNRVLMRALTKASRRPFLPIPVPAFVLKLIFGELSIEVLKSTTLDVVKVQQAGFDFAFPRIEEALQDLLTTGD